MECRDESALFRRYAETRDAVLRADLLAAHLPLARTVAGRFRHRGEPSEDLVQVAALGLVKAVDRFDPARGIPFASFAIPTMVGEIKRYFRDRAWALRVPRGVKDRWVTVAAEATDLAQVLGRSPTVQELADRIGASREEVIEALDAGAALQTKSLAPREGGAPDGGDETGEPAVLAMVDRRAEVVDDRDELRRLLAALDDRERAIVFLRFYEGLTQSEIAAQVGVSQMHVSRLLQRSLAKLRAAATRGGVTA